MKFLSGLEQCCLLLDEQYFWFFLVTNLTSADFKDKALAGCAVYGIK